MHTLGLGLEADARLKLLRRYEQEATRQLAVSKKAIDTAKAEAKAAAAAPKVQPKSAKVDTKPTAKPAPTIRPHQLEAEAAVPPAPKVAEEPTIKGNRRHRRKVEAAVLKAAHKARKAA